VAVMRDTGIIARGLSGDAETATTQISLARTQLGILKNQMQFAGLQVGARTVRFPDGTQMRVSVAGAISRVEIYSPPVTGSQQPRIYLPNPQPVIPVVVPPVVGRICIGPGALNGTIIQIVPGIFNGRTIDSGSDNSWFDISGESNPTTWQGAQFGSEDGGLIPLFTTSSALALVDADGNVYLGNQPTSWETTFVTSGAVAGSVMTAPDLNQEFGPGTNGVAIITYPNVTVDALVKVVGKGGTPGGIKGSSMKGDAPLTGYVMVRTTSHPIEHLTGPFNIISEGALFNAWVNGIQIVTDGFPTDPGNIDVRNGYDYVVEFTSTTADYIGNPTSYNCEVTFGAIPSGGFAYDHSTPFVYSNGRFQPGSNSGGGTSTYFDASGDSITVACTISVNMTLI
jgi:hypothetical protein